MSTVALCLVLALAPPVSETLAVTVNGQAVPVSVSHDTDFARVAATTAEVTVRVRDGQQLGDVRIRPANLGITADARGDTAAFTLPVPCRVVVNVGFRRKLILFAEPPEPPAPSGPSVMDASALAGDDYQQAIDRLPAGGTLYFPPGEYRSGTLRLKSDMTLHLAAGALLKAVDDPDRIQPVRSDSSYRGFVIADGCRNLTIAGRGTIDANGYVIRKTVEAVIGKKMPGRALLAIGCRNLTIEDVLIRDSYSWMVHLVDCEQVAIRRVGIFADPRLSNGDGLDVDGCRELVAEDCFIYAEDDAISVKAAWTDHNPESLTFRNCTLWSQNATGIRLGTESKSDAFDDLLFENIAILRANTMLRIFNYEGARMSGLMFRNLATEELSQQVDPRYAEERRIAEQAGGTTYLLQCIVRQEKGPRYGTVHDVMIDGWTANEAAGSMLRAYDVPAGVTPYGGIQVRGMTIDGRLVTSAASMQLKAGEFANAVRFE